jgi:hypothetical protein
MCWESSASAPASSTPLAESSANFSTARQKWSGSISLNSPVAASRMAIFQTKSLETDIFMIFIFLLRSACAGLSKNHKQGFRRCLQLINQFISSSHSELPIDFPDTNIQLCLRPGPPAAYLCQRFSSTRFSCRFYARFSLAVLRVATRTAGGFCVARIGIRFLFSAHHRQQQNGNVVLTTRLVGRINKPLAF